MSMSALESCIEACYNGLLFYFVIMGLNNRCYNSGLSALRCHHCSNSLTSITIGNFSSRSRKRLSYI